MKPSCFLPVIVIYPRNIPFQDEIGDCTLANEVNEAPRVSTHKKVVKQQTETPLNHLTTAIHIMESVIHRVLV